MKWHLPLSALWEHPPPGKWSRFRMPISSSHSGSLSGLQNSLYNCRTTANTQFKIMSREIVESTYANTKGLSKAEGHWETSKINYNIRNCKLCSENNIVDEYHVKCPLKEKYIQNQYYNRPWFTANLENCRTPHIRYNEIWQFSRLLYLYFSRLITCTPKFELLTLLSFERVYAVTVTTLFIQSDGYKQYRDISWRNHTRLWGHLITLSSAIVMVKVISARSSMPIIILTINQYSVNRGIEVIVNVYKETLIVY